MTHNEALAYIAGIIDGEGCISSCRNNAGGTYRIRVMVVMCDSEAIEFGQLFFGGKIWARSSIDNRRQAYIWTVSKREDQLFFLNSIYPYLRVKRDQAEIALEWLNTTRPGRRDEEIKATLHERLKALKR